MGRPTHLWGAPHVCAELFPVQMEGVKLIVNKALSSHFQVWGGAQ